MTQNGQNREFRWATAIRMEIFREILHKICEGCFRIYGPALIPSIGAYKRGTFSIFNFTNR